MVISFGWTLKPPGGFKQYWCLVPTLRDFNIIGNFKSSLGDSCVQPTPYTPASMSLPTPPQLALPLLFPSQTLPILLFIFTGLCCLQIYTLNLLCDTQAPRDDSIQIHNLLASISSTWASESVRWYLVKNEAEAIKNSGEEAVKASHVPLRMQRARWGCLTIPASPFRNKSGQVTMSPHRGSCNHTGLLLADPMILNQGEHF